jgi:hypothetical protein
MLSFKTSVHIRITGHYIPEDVNVHNCCRENFKSYIEVVSTSITKLERVDVCPAQLSANRQNKISQRVTHQTCIWKVLGSVLLWISYLGMQLQL